MVAQSKATQHSSRLVQVGQQHHRYRVSKRRLCVLPGDWKFSEWCTGQGHCMRWCWRGMLCAVSETTNGYY